MTEHNINNIPVLSPENNVEGIIAMKHIAKYMISGDSKNLNASYDNILETLEAEKVLKFDEVINGKINIAAFKSETTYCSSSTETFKTVLLHGFSNPGVYAATA